MDTETHLDYEQVYREQLDQLYCDYCNSVHECNHYIIDLEYLFKIIDEI